MEILIVTRENLAAIFPEVKILTLGQSYRSGGIVFVSQTPVDEKATQRKVSPFTKNGSGVFMDSRCRRGNLKVFLVEEGGDLFYARYRSFKNKGQLIPPDEEPVCTTSGVDSGSPEIEGFFRRLENPLL